ncbi:MAG: hypothetical protein H6551_10305 [Chitinophagales bacterium]|nr:hypothetical protein [Chitinophagaceae bacterium]MCB9065519.1 hypothetical protein [Chitinophagales bacterium]
MNTTQKKSKLRFAAYSLLWSLLLYIIAFGIIHTQELRSTFSDEQKTVILLDKEEGVINIKAAKVSVGSFNKSILFIQSIFGLLDR